MTDPLTLTAVGSTVIAEGIKFLYGQAAEAVKRWRERKDAYVPAKTVATKAVPPPVFEGHLEPLEFHLDEIGVLEQPLLKLRSALTEYVDGLAGINAGDREAYEVLDAFRRSMEAVYQQRLTFMGEQRAPSGPVIEGVIDVETVAGVATGVEARLITGGRIVGRAKSVRVEEGGALSGVVVGEVRLS